MRVIWQAKASGKKFDEFPKGLFGNIRIEELDGIKVLFQPFQFQWGAGIENWDGIEMKNDYFYPCFADVAIPL